MVTQTEIDFFNSEGYLVVDLGIKEKVLDLVVRDANHAFQEQNLDFRHHGSRVQDIWWESVHVKRIALLPEIIKTLEKIYKRKPKAFQTLNFHLGSQQKLHSDTIHFNSSPRNFMCGVWIALEDIYEDNGPVCYVPGSHTFPEITMQDVGKGITYENYHYYEDYIENLVCNKGLKTFTATDEKRTGFYLAWESVTWG